MEQFFLAFNVTVSPLVEIAFGVHVSGHVTPKDSRVFAAAKRRQMRRLERLVGHVLVAHYDDD